MSSEVAMQALAESPVLRANAFHTLARAYSPPDTWPDDFHELLSSTFTPFGGEVTEAGFKLSSLIQRNDNTCDQLATAHARLFIGPFDIQAPPWASLYLDPEKQLMGKSSMYAARAFADAGLGPVEGPTDAPDHITHELEFMYFLAYQENETQEPAWREQQSRFWREHLGVWLPQLANLMLQATDKESVYRSLGELTRIFCQYIEETGIYTE